MITGIQDVYYNTVKPLEAKRFYTEALGLKLIYDTMHFIVFQCSDGARFALHPADHEIVHPVGDSHGPHGGALVTFKSDNVAEDRKRLEQHGAKILSENDAPWGHMLVFQDLDGNTLKLMRPKH